MLNFKKLINTNFAIVESVQVYLEMILNLAIPIVKMSLLSASFVLFSQALFSFLPNSPVTNIALWIVVGLIFSISTASFFKISEDIILSKAVKIYDNVAKVLLLAVKLFAVVALILGTLVILIIPMFYLKNPLFAWPYKALVGIFMVAVIPFVYFAPLAVALREANIWNSFTFSYYMVLERWGNISKSIITQVIFTAMIAFWMYFLVSLLFFPNSEDFFNFIFTQASAIEELSRGVYIRFIFWEVMQVFVFTFVSGTFIGINTLLFLYCDGSILKIVQARNKDNDSKKHGNKPEDTDTEFVHRLEKSKAINIDTKPEEEKIHHKTRKEVLNEIYPNYSEEENSSEQQKRPLPPNHNIIEDNYPKR